MEVISDFLSQRDEQKGWFFLRKEGGALDVAYRKGPAKELRGEHYHDGYEYILVLAGRATLAVKRSEKEKELEMVLKRGTAIAIEPGVWHELKGESDDFEIISIIT